jgi:hypothetical protein
MAKAIDNLEGGKQVSLVIQKAVDSKGGVGFWVSIDGVRYVCDSANELKKLIVDQFSKVG